MTQPSKKCLTLLGTASIQEFVFRSNRLRENAGASHLVENAMAHWKEQPSGRTLFVGGGNAAVRFDSRDQARAEVEKWTRGLLESAPGLRVTAAHAEYDEGGLRNAYVEAGKALFRYENRAPRGWDLGALPAVQTCPSTGFAQNAYDPGKRRWLSLEAIHKQQAGLEAHKDLKERYKDCLAGPWTEFPDDLGALGTESGASQIAIVHADGNGIGKLFSDLAAKALSDAQFSRKIGNLSEAVSDLANQAFLQTLTDLRGALPGLQEPFGIAPEKSFPVRPIVDGGDDLTFVCHGRLALMLAVRYLENFESKSRGKFAEFGKDKLSACAGVLIMPQKFPFARGYELAEELCASAKRRRKAANSSASWLDFQILIEGSSGSLGSLRSRYTRKIGANLQQALLTRPYSLGAADESAWADFDGGWRQFQKWPRSRAKALLEALAQGEEQASDLLTEYEGRGYVAGGSWVVEMAKDASSPKNQKRTPLFDPLEALDFYVPWPSKKGEPDAKAGDSAQ